MMYIDGSQSRSIIFVSITPYNSICHHFTVRQAASAKRSMSYLVDLAHFQASCLAINHSGQLGVSCGDNSVLRVWGTDDGEILRDLQGHRLDVNTCCWAGDAVIASGGTDMRVCLWGVTEGVQLGAMTGHSGGVMCVRPVSAQQLVCM